VDIPGRDLAVTFVARSPPARSFPHPRVPRNRALVNALGKQGHAFSATPERLRWLQQRNLRPSTRRRPESPCSPTLPPNRGRQCHRRALQTRRDYRASRRHPERPAPRAYLADRCRAQFAMKRDAGTGLVEARSTRRRGPRQQHRSGDVAGNPRSNQPYQCAHGGRAITQMGKTAHGQYAQVPLASCRGLPVGGRACPVSEPVCPPAGPR